MRFLFAALMLAVPMALLSSTPVAAETINAATLLTASTPAKDQSGKEPVESISLSFADEAELFSVTVSGPDNQDIVLFDTDYTTNKPTKKGREFSFNLPEPLSKPGYYSISYFLKTQKIPSLNGFIHFTIEPEFPAPTFASSPGPDEELTGPLAQISLQLDSKVDLILLDVQRVTMQGDEVVLTPVQNFMDGSTPETSVRSDSEFTFPLATPLTEPGDYTMSYVYSVTNPDGSISSFPGMVNFMVK